MNMFNRFTLAMQLDKSQDGDEVDLLAWQMVLIDDVEIEPAHAVDLEALARSLYEPGEHNIFTCGCGDAGCACIVEGVCVVHELGIVRWRMRSPVSYREFQGEDFCEQIELWMNQAPYVEYAFLRDQMIREFEDGLVWLRNETPQETSYSPYGFERPDIE